MWGALTAALLGAVLGGAGCGPDPALQHAERTTRLAARGLSAAEERTAAGTSGGEAPADAPVGRAMARADTRLADAEQTIDLWRARGAGRIAWETIAPCLAAALEDVSEALASLEVEPPAELRQAQVMAADSSRRDCSGAEGEER